MYKRDFEPILKEMARKYSVITIIGPRQSGKSTLSRSLFPNYTYVSLEESDVRQRATVDPRGFFKQYAGDLILDEVQRAPDLLSYIQTIVDEPGNRRKFVLTGSHQLLLMEKVTQSLAGRTFIAKLLPFSRREILQKSEDVPQSLEAFLHAGGYPRIFDQHLDPQQWLEQYYQTYVERDVRNLLNIGEADLFDRFVRLCAGRVGQLVNFSSLANDCGVSPPTANAWLSVLKTSFVCFTLSPHFRNFNKRLIKSPKLYFFDTGLLCYLLRIRSPEELFHHSMRGAIFENWVIVEKMKAEYNRGKEPDFYFWRDVKGNEVDLVIDQGERLYPIEIKSSATFHSDFLKGARYLNELQKADDEISLKGTCFYAGEDAFDFQQYRVDSWKNI